MQKSNPTTNYTIRYTMPVAGEECTMKLGLNRTTTFQSLKGVQKKVQAQLKKHYPKNKEEN